MCMFSGSSGLLVVLDKVRNPAVFITLICTKTCRIYAEHMLDQWFLTSGTFTPRGHESLNLGVQDLLIIWLKTIFSAIWLAKMGTVKVGLFMLLNKFRQMHNVHYSGKGHNYVVNCSCRYLNTFPMKPPGTWMMQYDQKLLSGRWDLDLCYSEVSWCCPYQPSQSCFLLWRQKAGWIGWEVEHNVCILSSGHQHSTLGLEL